MSNQKGTSSASQLPVNHTQSEQSTTALLAHDHAEHQRGLGAKANKLWQSLKDEDKVRKEGRIQHVSPEEATRITGYGENGPKSNLKDGKGDKRTLGALFFG